MFGGVSCGLGAVRWFLVGFNVWIFTEKTSFFFSQHFSFSWYKWSRCRFERLQIAVTLLKDHRVFIQYQLACALMTVIVLTMRIHKAMARPLLQKTLDHLVQNGHLFYSNVPHWKQHPIHKDFVQGRGYQSRVSFLKPDQWKLTSLRFRRCDGPCSTTNHIFISNDRMHTAAKLPDRNLRSWLFRCCVSVCFFNLRIMRAKAFMKNCYHLLQWSGP